MPASRGKPEWLKILPPDPVPYAGLRSQVSGLKLHTVCEEARCPNISECWSGGTATFLVLGDTCTRACKFCNVKTAFPAPPPDPEEPKRLAAAVREMGLKYVVVTSVDRDDLVDQGAGHFAACIRELKAIGVLVEVLIPDFRAKEDLLQIILHAKPDVLAHNVETVPRLQSAVRDPRANYAQSLRVLEFVKQQHPKMITKSSLMLGLGEQEEEVVSVMRDLRKTGVSILTLGQYLRPSDWHLPVAEYVHPERFAALQKTGRQLGFAFVASGPFVRSSYRAGELFAKHVIKGR